MHIWNARVFDLAFKAFKYLVRGFTYMDNKANFGAGILIRLSRVDN